MRGELNAKTYSSWTDDRLMIVGLGAAQGPNNSEASSAPSSPPQTKPEIRKQVGKGQPYQVGTASWYGEDFEGKPTASGEDYDMYDMTAAHPTLPLEVTCGSPTCTTVRRSW
jgi:rare lipoprotein A (peptidoglycan hydrolase)